MSQHEWLSLKNWAVIGASEKEDSYGMKITQKLLEHGYNTVPIARHYDEVLGQKAYTSILDYEGAIDVVDFVVNPSIGINVLDDVIKKGVKKIILQPGTVSEALVKKAEDHGISVIEGCVLVLLSWANQ